MHTARTNNSIRLLAGVLTMAGAARGAAPADACALLSPAAIQRVTGEAVADTKATSQTAGKVHLSQCFYTLPTFTNSISVTVTAPGREMWERWFRRDDDGDRDKDKDRGKPESEEEEAAAKAVRVAGVGDEAYWVHSFVGNLYVRKGNRFLRISLGGKLTDDERQERAKALAVAALRNLR